MLQNIKKNISAQITTEERIQIAYRYKVNINNPTKFVTYKNEILNFVEKELFEIDYNKNIIKSYDNFTIYLNSDLRQKFVNETTETYMLIIISFHYKDMNCQKALLFINSNLTDNLNSHIGQDAIDISLNYYTRKYIEDSFTCNYLFKKRQGSDFYIDFEESLLFDVLSSKQLGMKFERRHRRAQYNDEFELVFDKRAIFNNISFGLHDNLEILFMLLTDIFGITKPYKHKVIIKLEQNLESSNSVSKLIANKIFEQNIFYFKELEKQLSSNKEIGIVHEKIDMPLALYSIISDLKPMFINFKDNKYSLTNQMIKKFINCKILTHIINQQIATEELPF